MKDVKSANVFFVLTFLSWVTQLASSYEAIGKTPFLSLLVSTLCLSGGTTVMLVARLRAELVNRLIKVEEEIKT